MRGAVLAGGDWVLSRDDGSTELDIRFSLQTTANETIYMRSIGLFVASNAVLRRIRSGAEVPPHDYYFHTAILFETGAARLHDLNRRLHIGLGQRTGSGMRTDVFAVG